MDIFFGNLWKHLGNFFPQNLVTVTTESVDILSSQWPILETLNGRKLSF